MRLANVFMHSFDFWLLLSILIEMVYNELFWAQKFPELCVAVLFIAITFTSIRLKSTEIFEKLRRVKKKGRKRYIWG